MRLNTLSPEVFVAASPIVQIGAPDIDLLKEHAAASPRRRARICAHKRDTDPLHEMLIAIAADSYIHPHKHLDRSESFHIVEGVVDVVVMDESGGVTEVLPLGAPGSGRAFYYRLDGSLFHTLLVRTPFLVVHEVTTGPFDRAGTVLADFAPTEGADVECERYMRSVAARVAAGVEPRA